eukprot:1099920-Pelagomonas_calceolata.AAC.2
MLPEEVCLECMPDFRAGGALGGQPAWEKAQQINRCFEADRTFLVHRTHFVSISKTWLPSLKRKDDLRAVKKALPIQE